jgi:hypothetical protein
MFDLSVMYGSETYRAQRLKDERGRLKSEQLKDKEWPRGNSGTCLNNAVNETRCHEIGIGHNALNQGKTYFKISM